MRRRARSILLLTGMAAALVGCSTGRPYERPDVSAADAWRTSDVRQPTAWPSTDWWRSFGSPQLDDLIGQAQLVAANADIGAARAAFFPSVQLTVDIMHSPVCRMAMCLDSEGNSILLHRLKPKSR